MTRGEGVRCAAYRHIDNEIAFCERVESPDYRENLEPPAYAHSLLGDCQCGHEHMEASVQPQPAKRQRAKSKMVAHYDYRDENGELLFQVVRFDPKDFKQRRPDGNGGWTWSVRGVRQVLYRLPELIAADPDQTVFIVAGEKDVKTLVARGYVATTSPGGEKKKNGHATGWRPEYNEFFRDRRVCVLPDQDADGIPYGEDVANNLKSVAREVRIVNVPAGKDISDFFEAGYTTDVFDHFVAAAVPIAAPEFDLLVLLDGVRALVKRYVILPGESYYDAVALWAAHTHVIEHIGHTPRLSVWSPEPECGKSRLLEVLELVVANPLATFNTTIAAIFRSIAEETSTLLLDEADTLFGTSINKDNQELRGLLNAGHRKRTAFVLRVVGDGKDMYTEKFPVFAPVAIASKGRMPDSWDTLRSRSIEIPQRRRAPDEHVESFEDDVVWEETESLREGLQAWGARCGPAVASLRPRVPAGITDRAADCWRPLLAIAEMAGGDWPEKARTAAKEIVKGRVAEEQSLGIQLLAAIRENKPFADDDRIPSSWLVADLNEIPTAPWGGFHGGKGMSQRDLAGMLKDYGIPEPKNIRFKVDSPPPNDTAILKGYEREWFAEPWRRYLSATPPPDPLQGLHPLQVPSSSSADVADVADVADGKGNVIALPNKPLCPNCGELVRLAEGHTNDSYCDACRRYVRPAWTN